MTKLSEKLFGGIKMTWGRVIAMSVITGVIVGLLMVPKALQNTSLQQPGISYEFWVLFALFIVLNCEKPVEAGAKTFVAFLISQPLIYLVQVPFCWLGWDIFRYYPLWFIITFFTFPGGIAAWYTKKGNLISVLILSGANALLCVMLGAGIITLAETFPRMLISALFIVWEVVFFTLFLIRRRRLRVIAFAIAAAFFIAGLGYTYFVANNSKSSLKIEAVGDKPYELLDESEKFDVGFTGDSVEILYTGNATKGQGTETLRYRDGAGEQYEIVIEYIDGYCEAEIK